MDLFIKTEFGEFNFAMDTQSAKQIIDLAFTKAAEAKKTTASAPAAQRPSTSAAPASAPKSSNSDGRPRSRVESMFGARASWNTPAAPKAPAPPKAPAKTEGKSDEGFKGFLWIKCSACGKVKGLCAKFPMTHFICNECKAETQLRDLRMAHVRCSCCGRSYDYKTNIAEEQFMIPCFGCTAPVDMELNRAGTTFIVVDRPL